MSESLLPATEEEVREMLRRCAREEASIESGGAFSKRLAGGPVADATYRLATARLNRLRAYEPADLTVSVEAGMPFSELSRTLAEGDQILPLDPPFAESATVGGVIATDSSGRRRRRYGTARDMVIGMRFATLDGKLVSTGGMVVKNVSGLDMGKLMIGSFGTLAVITSVNFKVFPRPESSRTFAFRSASPAPLLRSRREILAGALQPAALDWVDPRAAAAVGMPTGHVLLAESSGPQAVTRRFGEAFSAMAARAGADFEAVPQETWEVVRECGPRWLETHPQGAVLRVSTTLSRLGELLGIAGDAGCAALLRAGNAAGILMAPNRDSASRVLRALRQSGVHGRLEAASDATKASIAQWDASGNELELMRRIKADFDPLLLLNRGRLYGVI